MNVAVAAILALLLLLVVGAFLTRRTVLRRAGRTAVTEGAELRERLVEHLERRGEKVNGGIRETGTATTKSAAAERVARVREGIESGEIDERMVGAAARAIGISKDEARRRLEQAGEITNPVGTNRRPVDRDKRRKKKQQAKRSKRANRR